ncbi:MAG: sensor histidine kinase [Candidatus Eiseniibacteriota bacterium]
MNSAGTASTRRRLRALPPWSVTAAMAGVSALLVGAMVYALRTGIRMSVEHAPLVDAAMEIRLGATTAHLWFEEILSGDRHESMDQVWAHLDAADWYAGAMLEGGTNAEGTYVPLRDPELRLRIEQVRARLADFRHITSERWMARGESGAGTSIDQRYDAVFESFVILADSVETGIQANVARDVQAFRRTQLALIAGSILLSVLAGAVIARYLAERDRAEREAAELRERLTHLARVGTVGEMATGIAHEINQPLTAIATLAQACRRMADSGAMRPGELGNALESISAQALRAGDVIRHLRSLVRQRASERSEVDINELVREVCRLAAVDTRMHRVGVRLDLAPGLPHALADPVQIQQVVLNLIRNAVEAMDGVPGARDTIEVRTGLRGRDHIEVGVSDSGPGLSGEAAERVFDPFFTTKSTGLGMGLSISRSIVASHGGDLWYTPNADRGITMRFSLPLGGGSGGKAR